MVSSTIMTYAKMIASKKYLFNYRMSNDSSWLVLTLNPLKEEKTVLLEVKKQMRTQNHAFATGLNLLLISLDTTAHHCPYCSALNKNLPCWFWMWQQTNSTLGALRWSALRWKAFRHFKVCLCSRSTELGMLRGRCLKYAGKGCRTWEDMGGLVTRE